MPLAEVERTRSYSRNLRSHCWRIEERLVQAVHAVASMDEAHWRLEATHAAHLLCWPGRSGRADPATERSQDLVERGCCWRSLEEVGCRGSRMRRRRRNAEGMEPPAADLVLHLSNRARWLTGWGDSASQVVLAHAELRLEVAIAAGMSTANFALDAMSSRTGTTGEGHCWDGTRDRLEAAERGASGGVAVHRCSLVQRRVDRRNLR